MTPCPVSFEHLNAYVDAELTPEEELEVRRHLDVCVTCRATSESLIALKEAVAGSADVRAVPHTLRERLATLESPHPRAPGRTGVIALAAAALVAVALARWLLVPHPDVDEHVTQVLVADHVHYLQVPDAIQLAARDPDRVGAWLEDQVRFPVRVPTLANGQLLGARLCTLWDRKVGLAFYEVEGRRVSLFVGNTRSFPVEGRPARDCGPAVGNYRVCMVAAGPNVLALVGDKQQALRVLPDLRRLAREPL